MPRSTGADEATRKPLTPSAEPGEQGEPPSSAHGVNVNPTAGRGGVWVTSTSTELGSMPATASATTKDTVCGELTSDPGTGSTVASTRNGCDETGMSTSLRVPATTSTAKGSLAKLGLAKICGSQARPTLAGRTEHCGRAAATGTEVVAKPASPMVAGPTGRSSSTSRRSSVKAGSRGSKPMQHWNPGASKSTRTATTASGRGVSKDEVPVCPDCSRACEEDRAWAGAEVCCQRA